MEEDRRPRRVQLQERAMGMLDKADPVPVEAAGAPARPLSLEERIRNLIRTELSAAAARGGAGAFEEEDDFDEEDPEAGVLSDFQLVTMAEELLSERESLDGENGQPEASEEASPAEPPGGSDGSTGDVAT